MAEIQMNGLVYPVRVKLIEILEDSVFRFGFKIGLVEKMLSRVCTQLTRVGRGIKYLSV